MLQCGHGNMSYRGYERVIDWTSLACQTLCSWHKLTIVIVACKKRNVSVQLDVAHGSEPHAMRANIIGSLTGSPSASVSGSSMPSDESLISCDGCDSMPVLCSDTPCLMHLFCSCRLMKKHESTLAHVAGSTMEASAAMINCLWEIQQAQCL